MYVMSRKLLITFVGMKDPYPQDGETPGPILSFLRIHPIEEIFALCTGPAFIERAHDLEREMADEQLSGKVNIIDFPLDDVISYEEIWQKLIIALDLIDGVMPARYNEWRFLLDSGTPQMKLCLFLAGRTGRYNVRLLQGIPPYHAQGIYRTRDITDATPSLPIQQMRHPDASEGKVLFQGEAATSDRDQIGFTDPQVVANSRAMRDALLRAERAGRYNEPVLILGETGTGKTILARKVHESGRRQDGPFIELNCSAIPEGLAKA